MFPRILGNRTCRSWIAVCAFSARTGENKIFVEIEIQRPEKDGETQYCGPLNPSRVVSPFVAPSRLQSPLELADYYNSLVESSIV